jgi:signal recognition particle subunit SRP54
MKIKEIYENIIAFLIENFTTICEKFEKASKMTEDKIESYKIMMSSMTQEEMENPKIIKQSRVQRIARGAGVEESEVKDLLKYYNNTKKTMKGIGKRGGRLGGGAMNRMMGQFMK